MAKSVTSTIAQVKGPHLIVESLGGETVVFDRRTNRAHMLDARATAIWNAAENGCSMSDVVALVDGDTASQKQAAAQIGISDLERAGLLITDMPAMPRRGLLKTLGTAALVPMVVSILAPTPAAAATATALGADCSVEPTCAEGTCTNTAAGTPTKRCCVASGGTPVGIACSSNATPAPQCCSNKCDNGLNALKCK